MLLEARQVAVVTGGASGIGLGLAEAFVERGLSVVLADVEDDALGSAQDALEVRGADVLAVLTDVSDPRQVDELARRTLERFGRVDVVCNNAGVSVAEFRPLWEFSYEDWIWILGVNLWGVIHGLRSFVPILVEQGRGHVVNTASVAGIAALPGVGPYAAGKHAVVALSETLAADLADRAPGVGVTVVCPGGVATRIRESARNRPDWLGPGSSRTRPSRPDDLQPSDVARMTCDAIEANVLHVAPGVKRDGLVEARVRRLLDDLRGPAAGSGRSSG